MYSGVTSKVNEHVSLFDSYNNYESKITLTPILNIIEISFDNVNLKFFNFVIMIISIKAHFLLITNVRQIGSHWQSVPMLLFQLYYFNKFNNKYTRLK